MKAEVVKLVKQERAKAEEVTMRVQTKASRREDMREVKNRPQ